MTRVSELAPPPVPTPANTRGAGFEPCLARDRSIGGTGTVDLSSGVPFQHIVGWFVTGSIGWAAIVGTVLMIADILR